MLMSSDQAARVELGTRSTLFIYKHLHSDVHHREKGAICKAGNTNAAVTRREGRNRIAAMYRDTLREIVRVVEITERCFSHAVYFAQYSEAAARRVGDLPLSLIEVAFLVP